MLIQIKQSAPIEPIRALVLSLSQLLDASDTGEAPIQPDEILICTLADGSSIQIEIINGHTEMVHFDKDGKDLLRIIDRTITLDEDDQLHVVRNAAWMRGLADRWLEIVTDAIQIDSSTDPLAQFRHLTEHQLESVKALYQALSDHFAASGQAETIDVHVAFPTDYWSGHAHGLTPDGRYLETHGNDRIPPALALLPEAVEIIPNPDALHEIAIEPLRMKPIRLHFPQGPVQIHA